MSLQKFCAGYLLPLLLVALGGMSSAWAQSAPAVDGGKAAASREEPKKSKRLDKHAPPWEVIWNARLWTDAPPTQDFVQATHPDPKSLDYAPLVGKDPDRPKPRNATGIAALQAELEGDIKANTVRGKAINDVSPTAGGAAPAKAATTAKARRAKRLAKTAPAGRPPKTD